MTSLAVSAHAYAALECSAICEALLAEKDRTIAALTRELEQHRAARRLSELRQGAPQVFMENGAVLRVGSGGVLQVGAGGTYDESCNPGASSTPVPAPAPPVQPPPPVPPNPKEPPTSPPPLFEVNSVTQPASSCQVLRSSGAVESRGYYIQGRAEPTYCDMVALGGGWQKIDPYPDGLKNGGATIDRTNYDLGAVGNFIRITGAVNGQGDFTAAQRSLPDAAEYFFKSRVVQVGGNNARGTIILLKGGPGTSRRAHVGYGPHQSQGAFNQGPSPSEKFVTYFSRMPAPGAIKWWSTVDGNLSGFTPNDLASLLTTPSTAASGGCACDGCNSRCDGDFGGPGGTITDTTDLYFYSGLYSDFSPAPVFEIEAFMRQI